jgi:hypothetical protein
VTSLYRRATPAQALVLRMIEGAVKNAADAHPEMNLAPQHRRSIAKRAAGTLTAQWPEVLARASLPASENEGCRRHDGRASGGGSDLTRSPGSSQVERAIRRRVLSSLKRPPFRRLIREISRQITPLRVAGQTERAEALVEVMKLIHRVTTEPEER